LVHTVAVAAGNFWRCKNHFGRIYPYFTKKLYHYKFFVAAGTLHFPLPCWYRGFPEVRPVFSPPMGVYFRWVFIWC